MAKQPAPRVHRVATFDIVLPVGETITLSPVFDIHVEGKRCAFPIMKKELESRASDHHYAFFGGDVFDMVVPPDLKRFQPSVQSEGMHGRDDWADAAIECAEERLSAIDGMKILGIGVGNHEYQYMKRHGHDVTSALAHKLKCARLGYAGMVRLRIRRPGQERSKTSTFNIIWHHGKWGGSVIKGAGGAWRYFNAYRTWDIACFGHNHWCWTQPESRFRLTPTGKLVKEKICLMACGTYTDTIDPVDATDIDYSEVGGYPQSQLAMSPWVRIRPVHGGKLDYGVGHGMFG